MGQGIIDSGMPREEIWLICKLWPSEYGEGTTMAAIDAFDFELTDPEMEQIRAMDQGEEGRYVNLNYEVMGASSPGP